MIEVYFEGDLVGKMIVFWGLVFKFNMDDIREVLVLYIIDKLLEVGVQVKVFDLEVMNNVKELYGDCLIYVED